MVQRLKSLGKLATSEPSVGQNLDLAWFSDSSLWGNQSPKGRTRYYTKPRSCMVQRLKPLGKLATSEPSAGQNQGLAWSSDSSLWGNQLLKEELSVRQNLGLAWSSDSSLWGN